MLTNNVQALLAQDISDPTDFLQADLRQLDASCRCTICGEFFDAPISLACGHCFCSLCIREHIVREPECPRCRKSAAEAQFRVNPVLEEVVLAWKGARSFILPLSREERPNAVPEQSPKTNATPRRFQTPVRNGRKRKHIEASQSSDSDVICVAGPSNSNKSSEIAYSSPLQAKSARKAPGRRTDMEPSSDPMEEELMRSDSLVKCPICGDSVEYKAINAHMDGPDCGRKPTSKVNSCSNPHAKTQWSVLLGNKSTKGKNISDSQWDVLERLPKVSYDVLKDKALKDLLTSQQLPVNGDRNTRIARHRRWVMMYNANLDKNIGRKTVLELRLELKGWEEGQKGLKYMVEDPSAYEASHKEDFSRLIEEARRGISNCKSSGGALQGEVEEDSQDEYL